MQVKHLKTTAALAAIVTAAFSMPASAQQAKLIVATLSSPEARIPQKFFVPWAAKVQEESGGTLELDVRHGFAIASFNNALDRLKNDVVQVTQIVPASFRGSFPFFEVGGLPFMTQSAEDAAAAMWRLVRSGLLDQELKDVHVIATATFGYGGLHFAKPPSNFTDLRGLKIVASSQIQSEMLSLLGAAPATMTPMDAYPALQRGTFDGIVTSWSGTLAFKLDEVTSMHLDAPLGTTSSMITMMKSRYNALPEAARKAIDANSGEMWSRRLGREIDEEIAAGRAKVLARGHKLVELTAEQTPAWKKQTQPVVDQWVKERAGGEEVLAAFRKYLQEVKSGK